MDTGLDQNQAELGVLVLAVTLKVLADGDSLEEISKNARKKKFFRGNGNYLLDQEVKVLGEFGSEAC